VVADHNQERADAVARELGTERAIGIAVDVSDEAQVDKCFAKTVAVFGQVDILVSNAGIQSARRSKSSTSANGGNSSPSTSTGRS
jgi:3-hydroxybutyrate dehydrogenase